MNELVFLEPNSMKSEPFTTSEVIAEFAEVSYRSVQRLIEKYQKDFEEFGQMRFEITPVKYSRGSNDKKVYHLNEDQATLLITYLKNTEPVRKFKKELVRQFRLMRDELMKRRIYREELKPIRRTLTDAINARPDHSKWDYKLYTDLAYKSVTGKNAAQLRKERGADKKAKAIEYMTSEEITEVTKRQNQFAVLVDLNLAYDTIKTLVKEGKT